MGNDTPLTREEVMRWNPEHGHGAPLRAAVIALIDERDTLKADVAEAKATAALHAEAAAKAMRERDELRQLTLDQAHFNGRLVKECDKAEAEAHEARCGFNALAIKNGEQRGELDALRAERDEALKAAAQARAALFACVNALTHRDPTTRVVVEASGQANDALAALEAVLGKT